MGWNVNAEGKPVDGSGKLLTDGRLCFKIVSSEDPTMPAQYIYGVDKDEILEKAERTISTAQLQIHRMRKAPPNPPPAAPPVRPAAPASADLKAAVADLSNPANVKTMLKSVGVDVDRDQMMAALRNVSKIAVQWESERPDYPKDPRNDRILMKMAANLAGGAHRVTAAYLDAAFEEAQRDGLLHEAEGRREAGATTLDSTVQPEGTPDSRTVRNATGYPSLRLRGSAPAPQPRGDTAQEAKWRAILETGTAAAQEYAIRHDPGYSDWVEKVTTKKTA
jgi:hypothetical protein